MSAVKTILRERVAYQRSVREDVVTGMGVPLSEPYLFELRFIAEHAKWSQRKFCRVRLEEAIDLEVAKIIREFNEMFTSQTNLKTTILPVGDGIGIGIKI